MTLDEEAFVITTNELKSNYNQVCRKSVVEHELNIFIKDLKDLSHKATNVNKFTNTVLKRVREREEDRTGNSKNTLEK